MKGEIVTMYQMEEKYQVPKQRVLYFLVCAFVCTEASRSVVRGPAASAPPKSFSNANVGPESY